MQPGYSATSSLVTGSPAPLHWRSGLSDEDADTTKTTAKTLWSETILEVLYETLRRNKPDKDVVSVLKEAQQKGFKRDYLVEKVTKKVDDRAAMRVRQLFGK
jgi:hypothetical protein